MLTRQRFEYFEDTECIFQNISNFSTTSKFLTQLTLYRPVACGRIPNFHPSSQQTSLDCVSTGIKVLSGSAWRLLTSSGSVQQAHGPALVLCQGFYVTLMLVIFAVASVWQAKTQLHHQNLYCAWRESV